MTAQEMIALYGLILASLCFVALFMRYISLRNKLEKTERDLSDAYADGFRAGHHEGSQRANQDGISRDS